MNCGNGYQGKYPKVLAVCSAGLLRSATIAFIDVCGEKTPTAEFDEAACPCGRG